jgi:hypothetical protein
VVVAVKIARGNRLPAVFAAIRLGQPAFADRILESLASGSFLRVAFSVTFDLLTFLLTIPFHVSPLDSCNGLRVLAPPFSIRLNAAGLAPRLAAIPGFALTREGRMRLFFPAFQAPLVGCFWHGARTSVSGPGAWMRCRGVCMAGSIIPAEEAGRQCSRCA